MTHFGPPYTVVFEAITGGRNPAGTVTWTTYGSKEDFEERRPYFEKEFLKVKAEGVTADDAYQLVLQSRKEKTLVSNNTKLEKR